MQKKSLTDSPLKKKKTNAGGGGGGKRETNTKVIIYFFITLFGSNTQNTEQLEDSTRHQFKNISELWGSVLCGQPDKVIAANISQFWNV